MWQQLRTGASPDRVASRVAEAFGIPLEIAARDVAACLDSWAAIPLPFSRTGNTYRFNGTSFSLVLDSPELEAEIHPRLAQLLTPTPPHPAPPPLSFLINTTPEKLNVYCNGDFVGAGPNVSAARALLLQEITRRAYGECDWLAILHAGACGATRPGSSTGACVVFPAASHSGKTTLAAALLHRGLTLYADDSVCLEARSLTIPAMPFALAVREGSWPLLSAWFPAFSEIPPVDRFGQQVRFWHPPAAPASATAAAVVFTLYQPGAKLSIQPLDTLQALVRLQESGFWVDPTQKGIRAFLRWLESLPVYSLVYSDLVDSDLDAAGTFISGLLA
jgi:hypothetical protein